MPEKRNKKSFFGGLFSNSDEKKDLEEKVQEDTLESAPVIDLNEISGDLADVAEVENTSEESDPLAQLKAEEPAILPAVEVPQRTKDDASIIGKLSTVSPSNDYTKKYNEELADYQNHQHNFEASKQSYDKILAEYEGMKNDLDKNISNFSALNEALKKSKQLYDTELSDFQSEKSDYESEVKSYKFVSNERRDFQIKLKQLQSDFDYRQNQLKEITAAAKETAEEFESKVNEKAEREADLKSRRDIYNTSQEDMELLSDKLDTLKKEFEDEKPGFESIREHYNFVTQIKNEYETLSTQYDKMQLQEDAAKVNFEEIQNVMDQSKAKVDIAEKIGDFTITPLSGADDRYLQEKEQFEKTQTSYLELKERYDTEAANFARIEKNYSDLSNSDNANRVALHYVTEEYNSAKELLARVSDEFQPVEAAYNKQKSAFDVIDDNYKKMSEMLTDARVNLKTSQKQYDETLQTYDKVEESYDYIKTQNAILKTSLATKEGQYQEVAENYDTVVSDYENERKIFEPLSLSLIHTSQDHDALQAKIDKARRDRDEAQIAYDKSSEQLSDVTSLLAEVKQNLDAIKADSDEKAAALEELQKKADETNALEQETLTAAKESYADVSGRYEELLKKYDSYSEIHSSYSHKYKRVDQDYQKTASLYRLAKDEYASISKNYQGFVEHGARVSLRYSEVQKTYEADKDYYDKVYVEYQKVQADLEKARTKKHNFDLAATHLMTLLIQDNSLTFPIYESTGHNYVDNYNLPTLMRTAVDALSLKEKPQLDAWLTTYQAIREELGQTANDFAFSLNQYQITYDKYLEAGGERLKQSEANHWAYSGIDLAQYVETLDRQVADWMEDYRTREAAFAILLNAYTSYLDREQQLINLASGSSDAQSGIQTVIALINAFPDYTDMYHSSYGDINQLASHLGVSAAELTKPRSAAELEQILRSNYYERGLSLIRNNVSIFIRNMDSLKVSYQESLENLRKQIQHFQITTGISTENIQIQGIINDDFNFEHYLETNLDKNYQQLRKSVSEVSSIVNLIRRAGSLSRVANRVIDTSADNTMVFNDKPITMSEKLMNTGVTINTPRSIPIPIEPDEPTAVAVEPTRPSELAKNPEYIHQVKMPDAIEEDINDLVETSS
ncbi:MAG: hypothetical protein LBV19_07940 [Streptococcaceae bacterium]|nr:hypothetical protein [Streptococcaceae bacterium]